MFAIIQIKGKQYPLKEKEVVWTDKLSEEVDKQIKISDVLLVEDENGKVLIGTPNVPGYTATLKVLEQAKGEKIDVRRYKSKVRYRKHIGFRPKLTKLEVVKISHT